MHQPRIIESRLAPRRFVVNLFGILLTRSRAYLTPALINHELIHTAQMKELGYIPFYILYGLEWLYRLIFTRHWYKAYRAITFEREAYGHTSHLDYLSRRRRWAQWRGNSGQ